MCISVSAVNDPEGSYQCCSHHSEASDGREAELDECGSCNGHPRQTLSHVYKRGSGGGELKVLTLQLLNVQEL